MYTHIHTLSHTHTVVQQFLIKLSHTHTHPLSHTHAHTHAHTHTHRDAVDGKEEIEGARFRFFGANTICAAKSAHTWA